MAREVRVTCPELLRRELEREGLSVLGCVNAAVRKARAYIKDEGLETPSRAIGLKLYSRRDLSERVSLFLGWTDFLEEIEPDRSLPFRIEYGWKRELRAGLVLGRDDFIFREYEGEWSPTIVVEALTDLFLERGLRIGIFKQGIEAEEGGAEDWAADEWVLMAKERKRLLDIALGERG